MASEEHDAEHHRRAYRFLLDGHPHETDRQFMTGSEIKAADPSINQNYQLWQEFEGDRPDQQIDDSQTVDLAECRGECRFYTVPPASFGCPWI